MKILKYGILIFAVLSAAAIGIVSCGNRGGTLASITITPADATVAIGTKQQFTAIATFTDGTTLDWTTAAYWTPSDNNAIAISNSFDTYGLATSLATGTTTTGTFTITATDTVNQISGSATLNVVDPISLTITPNAPFMAINTKPHQFTATATLADLASGSTTTITQNLTSSPTLSWIVDNTLDNTTATISSTGLVSSGTVTGTVTIKAYDIYSSSTPTATTTLTITDTPLSFITISPNNSPTTITVGTTQQFTATGNYPDSTTQNFTYSVIWSSSRTGFATIDNTGLATAVAPGTTKIKATDPITGKSEDISIEVVP